MRRCTQSTRPRAWGRGLESVALRQRAGFAKALRAEAAGGGERGGESGVSMLTDQEKREIAEAVAERLGPVVEEMRELVARIEANAPLLARAAGNVDVRLEAGRVEARRSGFLDAAGLPPRRRTGERLAQVVREKGGHG